MTISESNLTPGEVLIAAREKADLSLEQVAESTRIAPNMLRAIELDEYHKISGELYVKSFLRSYAGAVDLDPEELIDLYLIYTGATVSESGGLQPEGWDEQDVKITKVGLSWGWITLAVLVVVGGSFLFYWLKSDDIVESPSENTVSPQGEIAQLEKEPSAAVADSVTPVLAVADTLALGWQLQPAEETATPEVPSNPPPGSGKVHLPEAFPGNSSMSFAGGRQWAYCVRLISDEPGAFAVKRDAESSFAAADFAPVIAGSLPLPEKEVVAGRAYEVKRGFVVYWGFDDHLSLRLAHVRGVEVSFNGVVQDVARFRDGEEILLDSSRLAGPSGN